jgi:PhoH-like ATPase
MPLPKAPTKPATLLQPTDDLIAKPNRNKKSSGRGLAPQEDAEPGLMAGPAARAYAPPPLPQAPAPAAARAAPVPIPSQTAPAPVTATRRPAMLRESRRRTDPDVAKTFVLDTNVLMHDPSSLFRFEEHDIFLPMMTLEELDNHKKGVSEVARNVRQVTRSLDAMIEAIADASNSGLNIAEGIPYRYSVTKRQPAGCIFRPSR